MLFKYTCTYIPISNFTLIIFYHVSRNFIINMGNIL